MRGVTAVVLRNMGSAPGDAPGAAGYAAPAAVPASVDDRALGAALAAGRPASAAGLVTVAGIGCPTVAAGAGRPILLVHGLGHDAWDWAPFFVRCSNRGAHLLALDLPGFGLADKPATRRWDLQILVDAVLAAAASMAAPPVVVASSLGGHVAMLAALSAPERFGRLVLCAPGGLVEVNGLTESALRAYYSVESITARRDEEIVGNSRRIFARPGSELDDRLAARKLAVHRSGRREEFARPFAGVVDDVFRHVVRRRLGGLRLPCLFLSGARDIVVPPEAVAAAAREIGARFESFSDVGHCPHLEAPDQFCDAVMGFALS
jgi:pimeloyl-ACP methyl ester carboxylesterase